MRGRFAVVLVTALITVAGLGAVADAGSRTITVGDNFFDPTHKRVAKGTKVRFKWVGTDEQHNVVKKKGPGGEFASATTDQPGYVFARRFKKAGRYTIICSIHPEDMVLNLRVRAG